MDIFEYLQLGFTIKNGIWEIYYLEDACNAVRQKLSDIFITFLLFRSENSVFKPN